MTNFFRTTM
uniref:Uncharacterized protein n=1 Tax=Streptococcus salivarius TaxID=1304 RepID=A0A1R3T5A9_STRSL|nr:conserved protein of unknown function [Streptococcus salivarius]SCW20847.1 conserved protein of unknown function [Streptococcus salivarius]SCW21004.1 conserved protein of unknown function [Streptococcus salivarius]